MKGSPTSDSAKVWTKDTKHLSNLLSLVVFVHNVLKPSTTYKIIKTRKDQAKMRMTYRLLTPGLRTNKHWEEFLGKRLRQEIAVPMFKWQSFTVESIIFCFFMSLRSSEISLFWNLQLFYWQILCWKRGPINYCLSSVNPFLFGINLSDLKGNQ